MVILGDESLPKMGTYKSKEFYMYIHPMVTCMINLYLIKTCVITINIYITIYNNWKCTNYETCAILHRFHILHIFQQL